MLILVFICNSEVDRMYRLYIFWLLRRSVEQVLARRSYPLPEAQRYGPCSGPMPTLWRIYLIIEYSNL